MIYSFLNMIPRTSRNFRYLPREFLVAFSHSSQLYENFEWEQFVWLHFFPLLFVQLMSLRLNSLDFIQLNCLCFVIFMGFHYNYKIILLSLDTSMPKYSSNQFYSNSHFCHFHFHNRRLRLNMCFHHLNFVKLKQIEHHFV